MLQITKRFIALIFVIFFINNAVFGQNECREIGINLYFNKYWTKEMPFADLMLQASEWLNEDLHPFENNNSGFSAVTGYPYTIPVNQDGITHTLKRIICLDNNGIHPSGNYTLLYEGTGSISLEGEDVDFLVSETDSTKVYQISPKDKGEILLHITKSEITDPIRNVKLMLPNTKAGEDIFNPAFLEKLAPFSTIRFLNWTETNINTIERWEDRITPEYYNQTTSKGVAYEYLILLCNKLGKNMWLNLPHAANTQFLQNLAEMLDNDLNRDIQVFLEYSNEVWNTNHISNHWLANKGSSIHPEHQYKYAYFAGQSFNSFKGKFNNHSLTRVLCGQQAWAEVALKSAKGMDFFNLNDSYDAISCTGNLYITESDRLLAESMGNNLTVDQVLQMLEKNLDGEIIENMSRHNDIAKVNGKRLITYESSPFPQVQYPQFGTPPPYSKAIYQSIYDSRLKDLYQRWMDVMFNDFDLELMMCFVLADDNTSHYGSFGHLDNIYQSAPYTPAYQALIESSCLTETDDSPSKNWNSLATIYPNPSVDGSFHIRSPKTIDGINLYDTYGRLLKSTVLSNGQEHLTMGIESKGFFIIEIIYSDATKEMQKVLVW